MYMGPTHNPTRDRPQPHPGQTSAPPGTDLGPTQDRPQPHPGQTIAPPGTDLSPIRDRPQPHLGHTTGNRRPVPTPCRTTYTATQLHTTYEHTTRAHSCMMCGHTQTPSCTGTHMHTALTRALLVHSCSRPVWLALRPVSPSLGPLGAKAFLASALPWPTRQSCPWPEALCAEAHHQSGELTGQSAGQRWERGARPPAGCSRQSSSASGGLSLETGALLSP